MFWDKRETLFEISNKLDKIIKKLNAQDCYHGFDKKGFSQVFSFNHKTHKYEERCWHCEKLFNEFKSEEEMVTAKANKLKEYSDWLLKEAKTIIHNQGRRNGD